jgi:haloalkane dehalogenase
MRVPINFKPSAELYPFQSQWLELGGGSRVHYVDEGAGTPILMCHGQPTWSFVYRKVIVRLRERFRCIAMDLPGFGLSDRPGGYGYTPAEHAATLARLVEHLDLKDMVVMAQDWGGPIGMSVASGAPARVGGLVFMNTWYWPLDGFGEKLLAHIGASPPVAALIRHSNVFVDVLIPRLVSTGLTPEELAHYRGVQPNAAARIGVVELARQVRVAAPWLRDLAERAPRSLCQKPMLLVWGMRDPLFGKSRILARWKRDFPGADLITLPGANHFIQEDGAAEIADAVVSKFG